MSKPPDGPTTDSIAEEGKTTRPLSGFPLRLYTLTGLFLAGFLIWVNSFGFIESMKRDSLFLAVTLFLIFLTYPSTNQTSSKARYASLGAVGIGAFVWVVGGDWFWGLMVAAGGLYGAAIHTTRLCPSSDRVGWMDWILAAVGFSVGLYTFIFWEIRQDSALDPNNVDWLFSILAILLLVEAARRVTGPWLPIISVVFLLYGYFGNRLPWFLEFASHRGMEWDRLLEAHLPRGRRHLRHYLFRRGHLHVHIRPPRSVSLGMRNRELLQ